MGAKAKVSITLSEDILARVDAEVRKTPRENRSSVIERWLRTASRAAAASALREETVRYYEALDADERAEDEAISRATSRSARRVRYD
jgi:metal-responsive CopG/Arc/MetJ family transcriptional regulator